MTTEARLHSLDNLRTLLIFLVVVNHSGWVYEQSGVLADIWIVVDSVKTPVAGLVNLVLDLFIMPTIFFISGYFTPASLAAKGGRLFMKSRVSRIVIPWLIAVFTLMPLYKFFFLSSRGLPQEHWTTYFHFSNGVFGMSWLWFLPALFLFDCAYLLLSKLRLTGERLGLNASVALVFLLGFAYTFAVGAFDWIGWTKTPLIDFQNERLLVYFLVFWLGSQCYRLGILDIGKKNLKLYIAVVATLWIPMNVYILVLLNFFLRPGQFIISPLVDGTLLWLGYHLSMLGLVYCLVTTFKYYLNRRGRFGGALSRLSYNVYIIHLIVMAPIAMALVRMDLPAIVKYPILFSATWVASNWIAWASTQWVRRFLVARGGIMKHSISIVLFSLTIPMVATAADHRSPTLDLMPVPAEIELGVGSFEVDERFAVSMQGAGGSPRLEQGIRRMLRRLSDRTTMFFANEVFLDLAARKNAPMIVSVQRAGELRLGEDESYRLEINEDRILLTAETDIGGLRGLETFLQLLRLDENGISLPLAEVDDRPRFPWRGLMIDSSRHFMPVEVIQRNLDGMAAVKLNVLHWHLVDDQGFRVESLALPKLHELGSDGDFYTRAQIREVLDYAADRGIRVVPEFDLPGHGTAWLTAYPELGSAPGPYEIERSWGIFDPTVNPTIEETYSFLDTFFAEMAELFDDEFLHIGGDENNGNHWLANPEIVAFMKANGYSDVLALQRYFNERVLEILTRYGKRMVGWDEIFQEGLTQSVVIQSWRGRESLFEAARLGYPGILSNGYYIDLIQPTDFHYLNDPLPTDSDLDAESAALILGGEATMWAEFVSAETVDSRIWPRTAAIAERLWSPGHIRDVDDMYRRLDPISLTLEELGLQHERNRPMMLRRLCHCRDIEPLEVLLGAIEPVKIYNRGRQRQHTQFSPLTRMVDAAWPDAIPARRFARAADRLIASDLQESADLEAVRSDLEIWRENHSRLAPTVYASPALGEIEPMSETLQKVAEVGLEALDLAAADGAAEAGWLRDRLERLQAAREPVAQTELMIIGPITRLVCAAAGATASTEPGCQPADETQPATEH